MSQGTCPGCGRTIESDAVACPGCGRPLAQGTEVPPGWGVSSAAAATSAPPRWQLPGIESARLVDGPDNTMPRTPAELFRPPRVISDTLELAPLPPGGPGWGIRAQRSSMVFAAPAVTTVTAVASRKVSKLVYWVLLGGILATSSAAVILLAVHIVRAR